MTPIAYAPKHPVVFKDPDDQTWRYVCPECEWSAELDRHHDALRQAQNHYIAMHVRGPAFNPWIIFGWF